MSASRIVLAYPVKSPFARSQISNDYKSEVKNKFDCYALLSVSQDYKTQDLLLKIIKSFNIISKAEQEDLVNKSVVEDLERCLFKSLQGKSYLMVLDDIWSKEHWRSLKRSFPDNKNGSRVIITTRIKDVAEQSDEKTYVHKLRPLREDESWVLFCEKAFHSTTRDEEQENLGREMVKKCKGLPLAIVVLGGDFEIDMEKLIRLLVAAGFIPQDGNRTMEKVARDNLVQLINRSLIQIEKRRWGRVLTCRVHDLLLDLAIQKAKELKFVNICDELKDPTCSSVKSSCRRQVIYNATRSALWPGHINSPSRSLLFFDLEEIWYWERDLAPLFKRLLLLRVLDDVYIVSRLPEEIGNFNLLKYLGLGISRIKELPSSIVNLQRLQTLALTGRLLSSVWLPIEINKMQELRHLIGRFEGTLPIENLTNLQTLKWVHSESWNKVKVKPANLVNLRELQIQDNVERWQEKKVFSFESIAKLKNLQLLSVELSLLSSFVSLEPLSHCQRPVSLRLRGTMKKFPDGMKEFLPNLEYLFLDVCWTEEDPMPALEMLRKLTMLKVDMTRQSVKKFSCRAEGFRLIEILHLDVDGVEEWQVEEGAMPMLRGLYFEGFDELKIPERLRSIPAPAEWEFEETTTDEW